MAKYFLSKGTTKGILFCFRAQKAPFLFHDHYYIKLWSKSKLRYGWCSDAPLSTKVPFVRFDPADLAISGNNHKKLLDNYIIDEISFQLNFTGKLDIFLVILSVHCPRRTDKRQSGNKQQSQLHLLAFSGVSYIFIKSSLNESILKISFQKENFSPW